MPMLFESDVIDAVCTFLQRRGYVIRQKLGPTQRGDDIVATKHGALTFKLCVEAKGATSSRKGSKRYGRPFQSAQVRVHVAEALYKAATVLSRPVGQTEIRAGIALPGTDTHRRLISGIERVLSNLGIAVFFVSEGSAVEVVSPWRV